MEYLYQTDARSGFTRWIRRNEDGTTVMVDSNYATHVVYNPAVADVYLRAARPLDLATAPEWARAILLAADE